MCYMSEDADTFEALKAFEEQKVLSRSDTKVALSVVGSRYQVVQPSAVLEDAIPSQYLIRPQQVNAAK